MFEKLRRNSISKTKLRKINSLTLTPVLLCNFQINKMGVGVLEIPKTESKIWNYLIGKARKSHYYYMDLDETGTEAILLTDGVRTVQEISKSLEGKFGERVKPVEERLVKFYSMLYLNKVITFKELI